MTKELAADIVNHDGPRFSSGTTHPTFLTEIGSLYVCRTDGTSWQFTPTGWEISSRALSTAITNGDDVTLIAGMPIVFVGGLARRAIASSYANAFVNGLVIGSPIAPTLIGAALFSDLLVLPPVDWALITGELGGLTSGAPYYLGLVAGTLTTTPPSAQGQLVTQVGQAIDQTSFLIAPRAPILL